MKQKTLKLLYNQFNADYFDSELTDNTVIKITRGHKFAACAINWQDKVYPYSIHFYKTSMIYGIENLDGFSWESTLLHEMCHIAQYENVIPFNKHMDHDSAFFSKLMQIEKKSGIPQFWDFIP